MASATESDYATVAGAIAGVARYMGDDEFRSNAGGFLESVSGAHPVLDLGPMWLVSGHEELIALMSRSSLRTYPEVGGVRLSLAASELLADRYALSLPMRDGAEHRRLREITKHSFSREGISGIEGVVAGCVERRLEAALAAGSADLVADLAEPLPLDMSLELLGVPEDRKADARTWARSFKEHFLSFDDSPATDEVEAQLAHFDEFVDELARTADPDGQSLLCELSRAERAERLSHEELLSYVMLLLVNGLDTLTSAVADAAFELLRDGGTPRTGPMDRRASMAYFDEVLRFHSPVRFSARALAEDVELSGARLEAGGAVGLFFAAANRDPRRFSDPGSFDPTREGGRHLSYGHGPHRCLGQHLANLAGAVVLERLSAMGTRLTLQAVAGDLEWSSSLLYHSVREIPVSLAR